MTAGRAALLPVLLACVIGCATVRIEGARHPRDPGIEAPVAFIIFESSTPAGFWQALEGALTREMQRRGRAYVRGGFSAEKLGEVASKLVERLVADRVLPGTVVPIAGS